MSAPFTQIEPQDPPAPADGPWRRKFTYAFRGWKFGIRGQSSFSVHFFFAALVALAAWGLSCSLLQWGLLLLCIGGVLTAELFNSAIETLFRGLDEETRERSWKALDIAAGAVLMMCVTAVLVGSMVFLYQIYYLFWPK